MAEAVKVTRTLHHSVNVEGRLERRRGVLRRPHGAAQRCPSRHSRDRGALVRHRQRTAPPGRRRRRPRGHPPTGPHVCFAVSDLGAAIAELEATGIPFTRGAQGETVQIWFNDPAGNTVEIQQDPDVDPTS